MSRWRREATDDIVLEYESAMRQIEKARTADLATMLRRLDDRQPLRRPVPQRFDLESSP